MSSSDRRGSQSFLKEDSDLPEQRSLQRSSTVVTSDSFYTAKADSSSSVDSVQSIILPDVVDTSSSSSRTVTCTPETITDTINRLESLLDEAVKVAQAATEAQDQGRRTKSTSNITSIEKQDLSDIVSLVEEYLRHKNTPALRDATAGKTTRPKTVTFHSKQNGRHNHRDAPDLDAINEEVNNGTVTASAMQSSSAVPAGKSDSPVRIPDEQPPVSSAPKLHSTSTNMKANRSKHLSVRSNLEHPSPSPRSGSVYFSPTARPSMIPMVQVNGEKTEEDSKGKDELLSPGIFRHPSHFSYMFGISPRHESIRLAHPDYSHNFDLRKNKHIDISLDDGDLDIHDSCNHAPVARNWPLDRKRLCALVSCINTSCIGLILGIYAGEVPAIQYVIVDLNHSIILGNVVLYLGLMVSTLFLWPLPLLHGRKPYTIAGLMLALCLQVPQGISVIMARAPSQITFKVLLLLSRGISGVALGFCDINLTATLLDLFGASLQSRNPHQEVVDLLDVRRHGGGMGLWLGLWSWCSIGPLSLGFMIGAFIISNATVDWGFWTSQLLLMVVIIINLMTPEIRRSAFRRTLAELLGPEGEFGRIARGEIKMHLKAEGPSWWGEEVIAGFELVRTMFKQFGFIILALYTAWVYAQFVLVLMLIGSLASNSYQLKPIHVGLCALSQALGALFAVPFEKASWLSRARSTRPRTDSVTLHTKFSWSSHLVRRTAFTFALPIVAVAYTVTSRGPPLSIAAPCVMASLVGFFSSMAIAECSGMLFETFDTSDLQPGMTGRPARLSVVQRYADQRTNFSCYPRVMAGVSGIQALKYGLAAVATGVTGRATRSIGAMQATAVVAGILFGLTLLLAIVLIRWDIVQMIPESRTRRDGSIWEPTILGRPSGTTRMISILEAGRMTRWSEIRRRNRLESILTGG